MERYIKIKKAEEIVLRRAIFYYAITHKDMNKTEKADIELFVERLNTAKPVSVKEGE